MHNLTEDKSAFFDRDNPTALPHSEEEKKEWQSANRTWWEKNPMRYDWTSSIAPQEFSKEFYKEIDDRFFGNAAEYLERRSLPFDEYINFKSLSDKVVLEIGVGNGSHAQLLAQHAKHFTGIDLTDYAAKSTSRRFELFHLPGTVAQMDAEHLEFSDHAFDFVWSWGVIHHSSNTPGILEEIYRVLRPEGRAVIMVYHRGWWNYYVMGFLRALARGDVFRGLSIHQSMQRYTDGALARYYGAHDFTAMARKVGFAIHDVTTAGPKSDVVLVPGGKLKALIYRFFPNALNRFFVRTCRMGSFLIVSLRKNP